MNSTKRSTKANVTSFRVHGKPNVDCIIHVSRADLKVFDFPRTQLNSWYRKWLKIYHLPFADWCLLGGFGFCRQEAGGIGVMQGCEFVVFEAMGSRRGSWLSWGSRKCAIVLLKEKGSFVHFVPQNGAYSRNVC